MIHRTYLLWTSMTSRSRGTGFFEVCSVGLFLFSLLNFFLTETALLLDLDSCVSCPMFRTLKGLPPPIWPSCLCWILCPNVISCKEVSGLTNLNALLTRPICLDSQQEPAHHLNVEPGLLQAAQSHLSRFGLYLTHSPWPVVYAERLGPPPFRLRGLPGFCCQCRL